MLGRITKLISGLYTVYSKETNQFYDLKPLGIFRHKDIQPKVGDIVEFNDTSITKININKATQAELETIPGVGPSTALKIINYRNENGKYKNIEDIKNVSGIGDAKFEKMKDYITIK